MTLRYPELAALAPFMALVLALALGTQWRRRKRLAQAYDTLATGRLLPSTPNRYPRARLACLVTAGLAVGLASAGPAWVDSDDSPPPPLDLALVVDLSLSMGATDALPSRIARARDVVVRLTEELPSARFSLVTFAGWPYALLPATDDANLVRYFTDSLRVELVRELDRGSALGEALYLASATAEARARPDARRVVLVLSDGDVQDETSVADVASELSAAGVEIWAAGIGSERGATVFAGTEPVMDGDTPVVAAMNADLLRALADAGGGTYEDGTDEGGLEALVAEMQAISGDARGSGPPVDATFLLVLLAVPLLLWDGAADAGRGTIALGPKARA
ncbi:MAG: VWA domain-containing protein [Gemmatimonadetes bacterium]|nr:VWA domain-containing protein [Gemmatimonadota bacterium]